MQQGIWREYYAYSFENTSLTGGSGTAFTDTIVRFDTDANFEAYSRIDVATDDRIKVLMSDDSFGRYQQNVALDLRMVSGGRGSSGNNSTFNSFWPYWLPYPYFMNAGCNVTCSFADASGATNSIRLTMHGCKIRPGRAPWDRAWKSEMPFTYATTLQSITANSTVSPVLGINMDAHFRVDQVMVLRTGPALITVKDGPTDRQWMDKAVHVDNFAGNGQFPHRLPAPRFIERGSSIAITIQDLSGATNSVQVFFAGVKLFGNDPIYTGA